MGSGYSFSGGNSLCLKHLTSMRIPQLFARSRAAANLDSVCCVSWKAQRSGAKPECDASLYEQRGSEFA